MPVRLRYLAHDLEVPSGQFVIGRTPDCQLSLDDPLVSRRHAVLTVSGESAIIEDLGSRNGVLVNGTKIDKTQLLADGDVIKIGGQELTLTGVRGTRADEVERARTEQRMHTMTDLEDLEDIDDSETTVGPLPGHFHPTPNPDRRVHGLTLIGSVATKALALGRADEAERILFRALHDLLAKASAGEEIPRDVVESASAFALRLAAATTKGAWVEYVFDLFNRAKLLLPSRQVDELYSVVRRVKHVDKAIIREYVAFLKSREPTFGPSERFVLQRIESLERWAP